jgi:hypothetical protein
VGKSPLKIDQVWMCVGRSPVKIDQFSLKKKGQVTHDNEINILLENEVLG